MNVTIEVPMDRIYVELSNFFQYCDESWLKTINSVFPKGKTKDDFKNEYSYMSVLPTVPGGKLIFTCFTDDDNETKDYVLDLKGITEGIKVMADKYFVHFSDMINHEGDINTSSVFVQCCLFGDVIYV